MSSGPLYIKYVRNAKKSSCKTLYLMNGEAANAELPAPIHSLGASEIDTDALLKSNEEVLSTVENSCLLGTFKFWEMPSSEPYY